MALPLHQHRYSLRYQTLLSALAAESRWLIIQDLDGVCMGLVRDPRQRQLEAAYIHACKRLAGRFYVLTNGEHVGACGVNGLVCNAFAQQSPDWVREQGLYLPGLAAGGVQLQDCYGALSHPGVSEQEMAFLAAVPGLMRTALQNALSRSPFNLTAAKIDRLLRVIVLDNAVSPTVNIGSLYDYFGDDRQHYRQLQRVCAKLMDTLLARADARGLSDSFFVHLAPNLGSQGGRELVKPATDSDMGTTDFQFMVQGAVKDVGVIVLLNHYYFVETGTYPLGEDFNARNAPRDVEALLSMAQRAFDPKIMPRIVAVGDTVTSSPAGQADGDQQGNGDDWRRGGSDRGFLYLVQEIGRCFQRDNVVTFIDSSGGELNRPGVAPAPDDLDEAVSLAALQGITDLRDPLLLNFVFPGGHRQYLEFFTALAQRAR